jgi:Na+/H+ antiporter NhaD/arsenite permease-like protein
MLLTVPSTAPVEPAVVTLSSRTFVLGCLSVAGAVLLAGRVAALPVSLLAAEVFATILALFLLGSFKYQVHKNALTYGMLLVMVATFCGLPTSAWHVEVAERGWLAWTGAHVLSYHGLDALVHADTMLFILGLTFFVSAIAQTRMLEGVTLFVLRRYGGRVLPTIVSVTAVVAMASGILDGVSMIGLTIRTLVIVLMLAAAPRQAVAFAVMICTTVTTVCGVWLAYGEPPNLIMKANLHPLLGGLFFLRYCGPIAIGCYLVVARHLSRRLANRRIDLVTMDVVDAKAADVRFLQARRHGEVLTPVELVEAHRGALGVHAAGVVRRLQQGTSLGSALVREEVPPEIRQEILGHFVGEDLAHSLDRHYVLDAAGDDEGAMRAEQWIDDTLADTARERRRAQVFGALALIPFAAVLIAHGMFHEVPLFLASFAGFAVAMIGIARHPRLRALALRDAWHEYAEYYFLFPLFFSITLLTQAQFFDGLAEALRHGLAAIGAFPIAWIQFAGSAGLSAILDNNVVADFASRALTTLDPSTLHLFAMAQIAGYALGGCWTHIGCAQSVVAYAFIQSDVDRHYSPVQWMREMTPIVLEMLLVISVLIYAESVLMRWAA